MNRKLARRLLATVAASALMTLPASAALANAPEHANGGQASEQHVSEDDDGDDSDDPNHDFGESQHPSGKDRTDHQDKPQGNAQSDPDDDGTGMDRDGRGEDKPGMGGGEYTDDQDGNNGCGNDQDFEDDNNGLCGGPSDDTDAGDDGKPNEEREDENGDEVNESGGDETNETGGEETIESGGEETIESGGEETSETGGEETIESGGDEVNESGGDEEIVEVDADAVALPEPLGPVTDGRTEDDGALVEVLAESVEKPSPEVATAAPVTSAAPADTTQVLGAAPADTLPATGAPVVALGIGGLLTLGGGELLRRRAR